MNRLTWLLLLAACGGDKDTDTVPTDESDTDTDTDTDSDTDTDTDSDTDAVGFVTPPALSENTFGAGLTAWLDVETTEPSTLTIEVTDPVGTRSWTVDEAASAHHELITGFRADTDHTVIVTAHAASGSRASEPLSWHAEPLPDPMPDFIAVGDPGRMEPGVTLVVAIGYFWLLDAAGEVAWYAPAPDLTHQAGPSPRGTMLFQVGRDSIQEMSYSGELLRSWRSNRSNVPVTAIEVDRPAMHHDVFELPNGNFLTFGIEDRVFTDYPGSEVNPTVTDPMAVVAGDVVLEIDPAGAVVGEWSLLDLLDPYRIAYNSLTGDYWDAFFPYPHINDWAHANAIWYDAARDEVLVSLRHQDAVVGFDHATGTLSWIFAPPANWAPEFQPYLLSPASPSDEPAYHQHAASLTPAGNLLMFDNGNERASAFEPGLDPFDRYSRCLEVSLDHTSGTWTTVWSWGEDLVDSHYSGSLGDCDLLPTTGNHLVTFGNLANPALPGVRLYEVDAAGEVVWQLSIDSGNPSYRSSLFRSERFTDVIPGR